jgi:NAD(P)-dependent dehydrogenase (short-subunit alcohol dehydrogenase family)
MARYLVTGANRGIGLELCRQLRDRGDEVIGACRKPSPELSKLDVRVEEGLDVADGDAVERLSRRLEGVRVDALVHNAGLLERVSLDALDLDSIRRQFEINSLGPLRVTQALLPNLEAGARVAILTSLMGSMTDNSSGGHYGYRMSKAALNAAGVSLAHDLGRRGISVAILHPGMVATEMTGGAGVSADESVQGLLQRIDALGPENSGTFWHADGRVLPW